MSIKAMYPDPNDDQKVAELVMDYDSLTVGEMMKLERHSGKVLHEFEEAVNKGSRTDLCLLFLVCRQRDEPKVTLADVQKMPYHALVFAPVTAEPEDGGEDEGKAPSDEPDPAPPAA